MPHAENKPMTEYGDLNSEHHHLKFDREREAQREAALKESPPKLVIADGPGNLYYIKWSYGDIELPKECIGFWNHKGKASEAIDGAMARLRRDDANKILQEAEAAEQAALEEEVKAEQARMEEEDAKRLEEQKAEAEEEAPAPKPRKPRATRKTKDPVK